MSELKLRPPALHAGVELRTPLRYMSELELQTLH